MSIIKIKKLDETWMKILCPEVYMEMDIQDEFSFQVKNHKHDPRVRNGFWDGIKRLYSRKTKKMYLGLLLDLICFFEKKNWEYVIEDQILPDLTNSIKKEELVEFINNEIKPHSSIDSQIELYDYQIDAIHYAFSIDRSTIISATSSGKSLVQYIIVRLYQMMSELEDKLLVICVPRTSLVDQMYNDFKQYSTYNDSDWCVENNCQKIAGGYDKKIKNQIVITTWQSMSKFKYHELNDIGMIMVDETHTASAKILSNILENLSNCKYRHGLTGTLNDAECDKKTIIGLLGPSKKFISANELILSGKAAEVNIRMLMLEYDDKVKTEYKYHIKNSRNKYSGEIEFLYNLDTRQNFIVDMVNTFHGNTLVLFDRVDEYGKVLYDKFRNISGNEKRTFLITGSVNVSVRNDIKNKIEEIDNGVIWASFETMSTGVSIKKLNNLVFASSSKSKIRILQSVGRLMRMHQSKNKVYLIDIVDNLSTKNFKNFCFNHAQDRLQYYNSEKFKVEFSNMKI